MKIVLAFEGIDGAGKSSLAAFTHQLCCQQGLACTRIGRSTASANLLIGRLSQVLQEETAGLTPRADLFLRIAREYQRANLAALVPQGVVVLDRFVLSLMALARVRQLDVDPIQAILQDIAARAHLVATFFVACPLDEAARRIQGRPQSAGPPSEDFRRDIARVLEEDFTQGRLTGKQWRVDNSQSADVAHQQIAHYLLPYLGCPAGN